MHPHYCERHKEVIIAQTEAHQCVDEMFARGKVLVDAPLREAVLASKAQVNRILLNLCGENRHHQVCT